MRRWLRPALGAAVTLVFLWLFAQRVEWQRVGEALAAARPWPLLAAGLFLVADFFLRIVRWWWMVRALRPDVTLRRCVGPFLAGIALNNLLPLRAGDVARTVAFRNQLGTRGMALLGTLVIERVLDLMVLLGLFFIGLIGAGQGVLPPLFVTAAAWAAGIGVIAVALLVLAPGAVRALADALLRRVGAVRKPLVAKLADTLEPLFEALALLRSARLMTRLVAVSLLAWICEGAVFACAGAALGIAGWGPWFALATGTLATLIPSSPGYVGTFDYFAVVGLSAYGVDPARAGAMVLIVHALLWAPLTVAGLVCLARPGSGPLRSDGQPAADSSARQT